jgi:hypothetical protein
VIDGEQPARQHARTGGEHWWPVLVAIAFAAALHVALPSRYRIRPTWLLPAVLVAFVAALVIADPGRIDRQRPWLRAGMAMVIAALTIANLVAAIRLVHDIVTNDRTFANNADGLLATGAVIWLTNIIAFALWYWDLDRGGAAARARQPNRAPAFVFPEMQHRELVAQPWTPRFVDYLSLAFWTATAFSPADVSAIRPWAKLLMMVEALASLALAALVVSRAINVL